LLARALRFIEGIRGIGTLIWMSYPKISALNKLRVIRRSDFFEFNYFSLTGGTLRAQRLVVEKVLRVHAPWCFYEKLFAGGLSRTF
jgi:hypothetical protein